MRKLFMMIPALMLVGCGTTTPGVAVAALGLAGVGLITYCGQATCSTDVLIYGTGIENEALTDAQILGSGEVKLTQLDQILVNLNADMAAGQALSGAPTQVKAILASITVLIPLIQALDTHPATAVRMEGPITIALPPLTAQDLSALAKFRKALGR